MTFWRNKKVSDTLWITILFWGALLLLRPFSDHPLNDDWVYADSVRNLFRSGVLRAPEATVAALVIQTLWGSFFSLIFGLHYGSLRLATMTLAWLGGLAFHDSLRRIPSASKSALPLTFLLLFNPLFFVLTPSFMTDVNALALSLIALNFTWRGLATDRMNLSWVLAGSIVAGLSYGVRQTGIMIPVGITIFLWMRKRATGRSIAAVWVVPAAVLAIHQGWYYFINGPTVGHYALVVNGIRDNVRHPLALLSLLGGRLAGTLVYLGFFAIPMTLAFWVSRSFDIWKTMNRRVMWPIVFAAISILLLILAWGGFPQTAPYFTQCSYLSSNGLGCFTINSVVDRSLPLFHSPWFWAALNFVSGLSLISLLFNSFKVRDDALLFWTLPLVLMFGLTMAFSVFYDRYILILIPALIIAGSLGLKTSGRSRAAVWSGVAAFALFSWAGTYDYLRIMDAAWDLGLRAEAARIPSDRIFASLDWCWSHEYNERIVELKKTNASDQIGYIQLRCNKDPMAVVSFHDSEQWSKDRKAAQEFFSPWIFRKQSLYLYFLREDQPKSS